MVGDFYTYLGNMIVCHTYARVFKRSYHIFAVFYYSVFVCFVKNLETVAEKSECRAYNNSFCVKFLKLVNPEKKGSIFETDFNKKWLNSCDEAQKMQVYRAGFVAYNAGIKCCVALWILSLVGMTALDTGVLPVIMTSIFLLVLTVSYCVECIKQGC